MFPLTSAILLKIVETVVKSGVVHRGPYDWDWSPKRFPRSKEIFEMSQPKIGAPK